MIRWLKISDYAIKSDDGRWRICKVTVKGEDRYEVWHGKTRVGDYGTAQEAKDNAVSETRSGSISRA